MTGVRPFFHQLGVSLFGVDTRNQEAIEARAVKSVALQRVIREAAPFVALTAAPGWPEYQARAEALLAARRQRLIHGKAEEFLALQASVQALEEVLAIVPAEVAKAEAARKELVGCE